MLTARIILGLGLTLLGFTSQVVPLATGIRAPWLPDGYLLSIVLCCTGLSIYAHAQGSRPI